MSTVRFLVAPLKKSYSFRVTLFFVYRLVERRTDIVYKLALCPRFDSWWHHLRRVTHFEWLFFYYCCPLKLIMWLLGFLEKWWMPSALLVQLRQLHPLEVSDWLLCSEKFLKKNFATLRRNPCKYCTSECSEKTHSGEAERRNSAFLKFRQARKL